MRNGGSAPMLSCPGSCRRKFTCFREQWAPCRPQRVRPVATQADALVLLLKAPICGPEGRARLSRYPHRVAISNVSLLAADADAVTYKGQGLPR